MRDNLRAALELADMGDAIFPLHSPTAAGCDCGNPTCGSAAKHPRTRHGLKDASTALDQITEWWRMWPQANIGVATGPPSGVVVVDVDPRHEGDIAWAKLCEEHAYEHTGPVSATGGGGWHYWFKHPGSFVPSRNGDLGTGIDVKSDGGYVVAPGSVHATGAAYEWYAGSEPWNCRVGEIPGWLLDLMRRRMEAQHRAEPVPDIIRDGYRHEHLLSLAGSMRSRNMGERAIFKALLEENAEKCVPPVTQTDIAKLAASAGSWPPGEARILKFPNSKTAGGTAERPRHYEPSPFSAAELEHEEIPEPRWAVPGLVPEGYAVLGGKPKQGKSWLVMNAAIAVAEGGIAFGEIPVEDGLVLMLALEDTKRRLQSRLRKLLPAGWPARLLLEKKWPRTDEGGLELLDTWLGGHPECRLVVIDTLARFRPRPQGKRGDIYAEDYDFGTSIQELASRHGCAIVGVTHLNKAIHEDWIDGMQGSAGVTGSADTLLHLSRPRGKKDEDAKLRVTGRDVDEMEYAIQFDGQTGHWTILGDADDAQASKEHATLLIFMARVGRPLDKAEVAAGLKLTKATAYMRLYRAHLDGAIASLGNGFYGLHKSDEVPLTASSVSDVRPVRPLTSPTDLHDLHDLQHLHDLNDSYLQTANQPVSERIEGALEPEIGSGVPLTRPLTRPLTEEGHVRGDGHKVVEERARPQEIGPPIPCPKCGERAWVRRAAGGWICGDCKPWLLQAEEGA